ncbi:37S ribosomal protein S23 mitochondrial [Spathaspora sp. JA1]|nr:37S ribosomal protein S23 mitochondrial [Spathaspora sp. JA1]
MLRSTSRLVVGSGISTTGIRTIATTAISSAPRAKSSPTAAKANVKKWGSSNGASSTKPKKTGMTHLKFRDAIYSLKWEKYAPELPPIPNLSSKKLVANSSHMARYSTSVEQALLKFGGFKKYQYHELFQNPVTLANENTFKINQEFISKLSGNSRDNRIYITGEQGIGKSTLITQTLGMALEDQNAVILHFDSAKKILDGTSDYIFNSELKLYQQPMLTKKWVYKFKQANEPVLKTLKLTKEAKFNVRGKPVTLKAGVHSLFDYVSQCHDFGTVGPTQGFQFLINQLKAHSETVPVIVSVDEFNTMADVPISAYRNADFKYIHAFEFEIADFLFKCASGELNFAKGGVILANTSTVNNKMQTVQVALDKSKYDAYANHEYFDKAVADRLLQNGEIKEFKMSPLTKDDTRQLMAFWKDTGVLSIRPDYTKKDINSEEPITISVSKQFENIVNLQYVSTQGNPGYLLKKSTMHY